ncbi:hypothetical protein ACEQ8H_008632 [Pleosporales sp. CAS-2024a]
MSSRSIFSWSKRQSASEYYRTGGIVPIDSPHLAYHGVDAKMRPTAGRKLPLELNMTTTENKPYLPSPPCAATYPRPLSIHKPLPGRPRSLSLPSTTDLPVELPGSILQENQGFPIDLVPDQPPSPMEIQDQEDLSTLLHLFPAPLLHAKSVPEFAAPSTDMRSVGSGNALNSSLAPTPGPLTVRTLQPSPFILQEPARNNAYQDGRQVDLGRASTPTHSVSRSKRIEQLHSVIQTQKLTISTLQAQLVQLSASHDTYLERLADVDAADVASLDHEARALEAGRPTNHSSDASLLFLIDSTGAQTPICTSAECTTNAAEKQQHSPRRARDSPDMETLKRKLSSTRRPENASRNLLPELNQCKQNNVALQKQIESLMAKLNDAKQRERALKLSLEEMTQSRDECAARADAASDASSKTQALQNTIDHLESRLEIANVEKLDAEEQLFNFQAHKSPFDLSLPSLQIPPQVHYDQAKASHSPPAQSAHMSTSTVFSSCSPISPDKDSQERSTLAAFVAHIERLQDQVRQKDAEAAELIRAREDMQQKHNHMIQEHRALTLHMDIQNDLLQKTQRTDAHIEQMRTAILEREAVISEKDKTIRALGRQLEHHKLLLEAQIRRHATMTLFAATSEDPLPELSTLTAQYDIDRWIEKLQERLAKERPLVMQHQPEDPIEARLAGLRREIDFYIREIIYYKLDIRGYKSDIKKLKKVTAQLRSHASRASDLESDTSSLRPAATPITTPDLDSSRSPATSRPTCKPHPLHRPLTPPPSASIFGFQKSNSSTSQALDSEKASFRIESRDPMTPQTPLGDARLPRTDHVDQPCSSASVGPEKSRSSVRNRIKFGELLTHMSTSAPSTPQKHKRSMSESIVPTYTTAGPPTQSLGSPFQSLPRSASVFGTSRGRATPDRPPRPLHSLFDAPASRFENTISTSAAQQASPEAHNTASTPAVEAAEQISLSRDNSTRSTLDVDGPFHAHTVQEDTRQSLSLALQNGRPRTASASTEQEDASNQMEATQERNLSAASSFSIPFVIGIGSPHNSALVGPNFTMHPTPCSITRNAPLKIDPKATRTGVGGIMASSARVASAVSPTETSVPGFPARQASQTRRLGFSRKRDMVSPKTPSHSRNASGGSIRTAIRLPKTSERERETDKVRKCSIGVPQMMGDGFGHVRMEREP